MTVTSSDLSFFVLILPLLLVLPKVKIDTLYDRLRIHCFSLVKFILVPYTHSIIRRRKRLNLFLSSQKGPP